MNADLQNRIKPHVAPSSRDFSDAKVKTATPQAVDSNAENKTSFRDLLMNSNADMSRQRAAQKNGNAMTGAKTDAEFAKMMMDKANKENIRVPQNDLDKDAFLKLFVTQMQNQDPLNPDDSSEMAAQLAQFNGLEQMLNVNKNLEKMQTEQSVARNVSLVSFVGKEIKLDGGKLKLEDGKLTDAVFHVEKDAPRSTLEVRDPAGVVVTTEDLGTLRAGDHALEWDGIGKDGKKVANGVYTFSVVAKDLNDQDIPVRVTSNVKVTGVDMHDNGGSFYTDLGKVRISEVASVGESGFDKPTQDALKKKAAEEAAKAAGQTGQTAEQAGGAVPVPAEVADALGQQAAAAAQTAASEPASAPAPKFSSLPIGPGAPEASLDSLGIKPQASTPTAAGSGVIEVPVPQQPASRT